MSEPVERETQLVRPRYRREIVWLLVALVLCAEVAASLVALLDIQWTVLALTLLVGLATISFALVRGSVGSLFGSRGRKDGESGPPAAQSVAVVLAMSMGIVFYTYLASFFGVLVGWSDIDDLDPPSPAAALFSPSGQFWLLFNPFSLVCEVAIVLLFARMLYLSRVGLSKTTIQAVA